MMEDFKGRIGIDRAQSTYKQYEVLYKQLKQFLREEYHIEDIPLAELDLSFIEALNFFFRVKRKMKPRTVKARIVLLNKVIRWHCIEESSPVRLLTGLNWKRRNLKTSRSPMTNWTC